MKLFKSHLFFISQWLSHIIHYIENLLKISEIFISFNLIYLVLNYSKYFSIFKLLLHFNEQTVSQNLKNVELSLWRIFDINFISNCFEGLFSHNWSYKSLEWTFSRVVTILKNAYLRAKYLFSFWSYIKTGSASVR